MDSAHLCVAGLPLAIYLLGMSTLNLTRQPRVSTGARNLAGLAFAIAGFCVVGPLDLFLPFDAVRHYSTMIWPMLICFYCLCLTLLLLVSRPRLIVYNVRLEKLRPVLETVASKLDSDARWAGDSLHLPQLGVQLHLDEFRPLRNVSLMPVGEQQSFIGWRRLQTELSMALKQIEVRPNRYGFLMLGLGFALLICPIVLVATNPVKVAQQLLDLFRLS
ncbi:MAG TPA: hypothetical protein VFE24_09875 [Pirellulales bacterium]|jgi:hypothetical protein|nr:hypothetical protein [Pirellulales bacterium]